MHMCSSQTSYDKTHWKDRLFRIVSKCIEFDDDVVTYIKISCAQASDTFFYTFVESCLYIQHTVTIRHIMMVL